MAVKSCFKRKKINHVFILKYYNFSGMKTYVYSWFYKDNDSFRSFFLHKSRGINFSWGQTNLNTTSLFMILTLGFEKLEALFSCNFLYIQLNNFYNSCINFRQIGLVLIEKNVFSRALFCLFQSDRLTKLMNIFGWNIL